MDVAVETSGATAGLQAAVSAPGLGGRVVTVGFYQGGAPELALGEEWHHNRLDMVSSMGAWGAPHRAYPAWDRVRVLETVVDLLATGAVRTDELPVRRFPFADAVDAYGWLDENPNEAVKVAFTYARREMKMRRAAMICLAGLATFAVGCGGGDDDGGGDSAGGRAARR